MNQEMSSSMAMAFHSGAATLRSSDVVVLSRRDSQNALNEAMEASCAPKRGYASTMAGTTCHSPRFHKTTEDLSAPDLFREDDSDVGPRLLTTPAGFDASMMPTDLACADVVNVFNQALFLHCNSHLLQAAQLYELVSITVQNLLQSSMSSACLMELGMKAHNNHATISFARGDVIAAGIGFEASLLFARQLLDCSDSTFQLDYASVLSNWCQVSWKKGDVSPLLYQALAEVLRLRSSILPWDHQDIASAHYNIGVAEYATNQTESTASHLMQYLKIAAHRSKAGLMDLDPIPALTYLLLLQNEDKDDRSSQDLVRGLRALQDKRREQGPESAEVASVLNFIGTLLFHKTELDHALLFFQEELRLEQQLIECVNDISVSVTCNNIGRILQELGNFEEAVVYYKRALDAEAAGSGEGRILQQGGRSSTTPFCQSTSNLFSTVWYNLGLIHDKLGAYPQAIEAFSKSLELRKAMLGSDHPDIACLYYNIGVLQMEQQLLNDASTSFSEALRIRYHGAGNQLNDDRVIKTLEKLASLYKGKGNIKGAVHASQEILKILESSTEYCPRKCLRDSALLLRTIAELHHAGGDMTSALSAAQMSVDKFGTLLTSEPSRKESTMYSICEQLATSLVLLGSLHHEQSEPVLADRVLSRAVQMLDTASRGRTATLPSSLHVLREVAAMLANNHCAPEA